MENNQERVMAYTLATTLDEKMLENVGGGSMHPTAQPSGKASSADGWFVGLDVHMDW